MIDLFCHCCLSLKQCNIHGFVVNYLHGETATIAHEFCSMQSFLRNNNHFLVFPYKSTNSSIFGKTVRITVSWFLCAICSLIKFTKTTSKESRISSCSLFPIFHLYGNSVGGRNPGQQVRFWKACSSQSPVPVCYSTSGATSSLHSCTNENNTKNSRAHF